MIFNNNPIGGMNAINTPQMLMLQTMGKAMNAPDNNMPTNNTSDQYITTLGKIEEAANQAGAELTPTMNGMSNMLRGFCPWIQVGNIFK